MKGHKYVRQVQSRDIQYNVSQASCLQEARISRQSKVPVEALQVVIYQGRWPTWHSWDLWDQWPQDHLNSHCFCCWSCGSKVSTRGCYCFNASVCVSSAQQGRSIHYLCHLEPSANIMSMTSQFVLLKKISNISSQTMDSYMFARSIRDGLPSLSMKP